MQGFGMHGSRGELSLGSELSVWVVRSAVTPRRHLQLLSPDTGVWCYLSCPHCSGRWAALGEGGEHIIYKPGWPGVHLHWGIMGVSPWPSLSMFWGSFMETNPREGWVIWLAGLWETAVTPWDSLLWTGTRNRQLLLGKKRFGDCFLDQELLTVDRKHLLVLQNLNNP